MKVLFIAPHLSTGGMPAFLLKRIQALQQYTDYEIHVIEWKFYSPQYIVQREQIQKLVGKNFHAYFGEINKQKDVINYCYKNKIDIIHIEEIPEGFDTGNIFDLELQKDLYDKKHPWKVVETCHNIYFNPKDNKINHPDGYACVTPYHIDETFKLLPSKKSLIPFPIDPSIQTDKTREEILDKIGYRRKGEFHIINVGLWTSGKNQGYALEIAKNLYQKYGYTYIFHFIGNQAPNFSDYWKPLIKDISPNVLIWGEKNNTKDFFRIADLMLFTSTWECNPIVLKEAISNNIKIMANNLDHYGDEYLPFIHPLTSNTYLDSSNLIDVIHSPIKYNNSNIKNSVKNFADKHVKFYTSLLNEK